MRPPLPGTPGAAKDVRTSTEAELKAEATYLKSALVRTNERIVKVLGEAKIHNEMAEQNLARRDAEAPKLERAVQDLSEENARLRVTTASRWENARRLQVALRALEEHTAEKTEELTEAQRQLEQENAKLRREATTIKARLQGWRQLQRRYQRHRSESPMAASHHSMSTACSSESLPTSGRQSTAASSPSADGRTAVHTLQVPQFTAPFTLGAIPPGSAEVPQLAAPLAIEVIPPGSAEASPWSSAGAGSAACFLAAEPALAARSDGEEACVGLPQGSPWLGAGAGSACFHVAEPEPAEWAVGAEAQSIVPAGVDEPSEGAYTQEEASPRSVASEPVSARLLVANEPEPAVQIVDVDEPLEDPDDCEAGREDPILNHIPQVQLEAGREDPILNHIPQVQLEAGQEDPILDHIPQVRLEAVPQAAYADASDESPGASEAVPQAAYADSSDESPGAYEAMRLVDAEVAGEGGDDWEAAEPSSLVEDPVEPPESGEGVEEAPPPRLTRSRSQTALPQLPLGVCPVPASPAANIAGVSGTISAAAARIAHGVPRITGLLGAAGGGMPPPLAEMPREDSEVPCCSVKGGCHLSPSSRGGSSVGSDSPRAEDSPLGKRVEDPIPDPMSEAAAVDARLSSSSGGSAHSGSARSRVSDAAALAADAWEEGELVDHDVSELPQEAIAKYGSARKRAQAALVKLGFSFENVGGRAAAGGQAGGHAESHSARLQGAVQAAVRRFEPVMVSVETVSCT